MGDGGRNGCGCERWHGGLCVTSHIDYRRHTSHLLTRQICCFNVGSDVRTVRRPSFANIIMWNDLYIWRVIKTFLILIRVTIGDNNFALIQQQGNYNYSQVLSVQFRDIFCHFDATHFLTLWQFPTRHSNVGLNCWQPARITTIPTGTQKNDKTPHPWPQRWAAAGGMPIRVNHSHQPQSQDHIIAYCLTNEDPGWPVFLFVWMSQLLETNCSAAAALYTILRAQGVNTADTVC